MLDASVDGGAIADMLKTCEAAVATSEQHVGALVALFTDCLNNAERELSAEERSICAQIIDTYRELMKRERDEFETFKARAERIRAASQRMINAYTEKALSHQG